MSIYGKAAAAAVLVLLVVSCTSASKKETSSEAYAHYKLGLSHYKVGSTQLAFVEFQKSLELVANSKETHNALGTVYMDLEDLSSAMKHYSRATALGPSYPEAHNNLCYVRYLTKDYPGAVASCKRALENPTYLTPEKAFYNLGRTYLRQGSNDLAIDAFTDALRRFPRLHLAYYGMALALNAKKQYGNAADALKEAIALDSRFKGDPELAEREFMKMSSDPGEQSDLDAYLEILNY